MVKDLDYSQMSGTFLNPSDTSGQLCRMSVRPLFAKKFGGKFFYSGFFSNFSRIT